MNHLLCKIIIYSFSQGMTQKAIRIRRMRGGLVSDVEGIGILREIGMKALHEAFHEDLSTAVMSFVWDFLKVCSQSLLLSKLCVA